MWGLLRGALDESVRSDETRVFRSMSRTLSDAREAEARVECLDALLAHFADHVPPEAFVHLRERLVAERDEAVERSMSEQARARVLDELARARERMMEMPIADGGWDALETGFRRSYARARRAMRCAYSEASPERFHEWRKRAKAHYYHMELLSDSPVSGATSSRQALKELFDILGDDHDLVDLIAYLSLHEHELGMVTVGVLRKLAERRSLELRTGARKLGKRLFRLKPRRFTARIGTKVEPWFAKGIKQARPGVRKAIHDAMSVTPLRVAGGIKKL